jgi:hypothetical protein
LKTAEGQLSVGSNPTPSAILRLNSQLALTGNCRECANNNYISLHSFPRRCEAYNCIGKAGGGGGIDHRQQKAYLPHVKAILFLTICGYSIWYRRFNPLPGLRSLAKALVGHGSPALTMHYTHQDTASPERAINSLPDVGSTDPDAAERGWLERAREALAASPSDSVAEQKALGIVVARLKVLDARRARAREGGG